MGAQRRDADTVLSYRCPMSLASFVRLRGEAIYRRNQETSKCLKPVSQDFNLSGLSHRSLPLLFLSHLWYVCPQETLRIRHGLKQHQGYVTSTRWRTSPPKVQRVSVLDLRVKVRSQFKSSFTNPYGFFPTATQKQILFVWSFLSLIDMNCWILLNETKKPGTIFQGFIEAKIKKII